jgi:hypothetical protein
MSTWQVVLAWMVAPFVILYLIGAAYETANGVLSLVVEMSTGLYQAIREELRK